jgi:hypothetical protein
MDVELPETAGRDRFERTVTLLIGVATVLAALLVNLELSSHRREAQASSEASRLAVSAFRTMTTGSLDVGAKTTALVRVSDLVFNSRAHVTAASSDFQMSVLAQAEMRSADRSAAAYLRTVGFAVPIAQLVQSLGGVQSQLLGAVGDREQRFADGVAQSNEQVDRADRYARRDSRATLALAFLASAGALFGLAAVLRAGRAGWVSVATGALGVLAAAAVGISALLL